MILFFVFNRFFRILVFVQLVPRLFLAAAEDDVEDGFEEHESKSHVPDFSPVCHGWLKWERSKSAGWTCELIHKNVASIKRRLAINVAKTGLFDGECVKKPGWPVKIGAYSTFCGVDAL